MSEREREDTKRPKKATLHKRLVLRLRKKDGQHRLSIAEHDRRRLGLRRGPSRTCIRSDNEEEEEEEKIGLKHGHIFIVTFIDV